MGLISKAIALEKIVDSLSPSVSINTFFDAVSQEIDKMILESQSNGIVFIGGKTFFSLSETQDEIIINSEMYYKTGEDYAKQEVSGSFWFNRIHSSDRNRFINMLDNSGKLIVEIQKPI